MATWLPSPGWSTNSSQTRIPLVFREGAIPNIQPREHIRPTDVAPIIRPLDPSDPFVGCDVTDDEHSA